MKEHCLQIFWKIEKLNKDLIEYISMDDFDRFKNTIQEFYDGGVMEESYFDIVRDFYRYSKSDITINSTFINDDTKTLLDEFYNKSFIEQQQDDNRELFASIITHSEFLQKYGYDDYETEKYGYDDNIPSTQNINKRRNLIVEYIEQYFKLYEPTNTSNIEQVQQTYIDRIVTLIELRKYTYLTHNFILVDEMEDIFNTLQPMTIQERFEYLNNHIQNIYENTSITKDNLRDYIKFENQKYIRFTNYLQGKYIDRKRFFDFKNNKLPQNILFYIELAFYLCIPSSNEVEKFLNLFGYSIKSELLLLDSRACGKKTYDITYKDLCKWIDAGVSYDLINEMLGYELEIKDIKRPKTNKTTIPFAF